jgi:hypothetical protein
MTTPTLTPAGWYPDPSRRHEYRYWDGKDWSAQVSDGGKMVSDPELRPPATPAGVPTAHPLATPAPALEPAPWPVPASPQPTTDTPSPPDLQGPSREQAAMSTPAPGPVATGARRHRWAVPLIAIVGGLALIAGLGIWAPWVDRVIQIPAAVRAVSPTPTSVVIQWAPPTSGPTVDRYTVLRGGAAVGSVPGTATSYKDLGLVPATAYQYRVVAVSGDHRSAPSAVLVVRTPNPPISDARLQGTWYVDSKVVANAVPPPAVGEMFSDTWKFTPQCASGACTAVVSGTWGSPITVTLTRSGAVYTGTAHPSLFTCGPSDTPMRDTLTITITVRGASMQNQMWAATSLVGTLRDQVQETSDSEGFCKASVVTASLTGIPKETE